MAKIIKLNLLRFNSIKEVDFVLKCLAKYDPKLDERGTSANLMIVLTKIKEEMKEDEENNSRSF